MAFPLNLLNSFCPIASFTTTTIGANGPPVPLLPMRVTCRLARPARITSTPWYASKQRSATICKTRARRGQWSGKRGEGGCHVQERIALEWTDRPLQCDQTLSGGDGTW